MTADASHGSAGPASSLGGIRGRLSAAHQAHASRRSASPLSSLEIVSAFDPLRTLASSDCLHVLSLVRAGRS